MAGPQAGKFDIYTSQKGYHLNRLCHMLNVGENCAALPADKDAYLDRFPLSAGERDAVSQRDKPRLLALGGNMYFTAKLALVSPARTISC